VHQIASGGDTSYTHLNAVCPWVEALRPDEVAAANALPAPRVLKTHLMPDAIPPVHGRLLYIVRDPRDVALSLYHHALGFQTFDGSLGHFRRYLAEGYAYYGNFATWPAHVNAWAAAAKRAPPGTVLVLRYEDLIADLPGCLSRIAAFCGLPLPDQLREEILPRLSLAYMREHTARFDYSWHDPESSERFQFFRIGRAGGWDTEGDPARWLQFAQHMAAQLTPEARAFFPTLSLPLIPRVAPESESAAGLDIA